MNRNFKGEILLYVCTFAVILKRAQHGVPLKYSNGFLMILHRVRLFIPLEAAVPAKCRDKLLFVSCAPAFNILMLRQKYRGQGISVNPYNSLILKTDTWSLIPDSCIWHLTLVIDFILCLRVSAAYYKGHGTPCPYDC